MQIIKIFHREIDIFWQIEDLLMSIDAEGGVLLRTGSSSPAPGNILLDQVRNSRGATAVQVEQVCQKMQSVSFRYLVKGFPRQVMLCQDPVRRVSGILADGREGQQGDENSFFMAPVWD
jgi:hypothetical protein